MHKGAKPDQEHDLWRAAKLAQTAARVISWAARSGKNKTITTGWVNLVDEKDIPRLTPWEFQLAHIMRLEWAEHASAAMAQLRRSAMALEYTAKKKKDSTDRPIDW